MPSCRWAPSLGELECGKSAKPVWGTKDYVYKEDKHKPTVFWGLYDLRDYMALWRHRGKAWVFWAGSDIRNLLRGFAFNDGKLKKLSKITGNWWVYKILEKAEHWVENYVERDALLAVGIEAHVCPSFLGNIEDFKVSYKKAKNPKVYLCSSEGRQEEYGFDVVERIADKLPRYQFHLYGATWKTTQPNVIVHGRVPKEQMNEEIKNMQIGLRLNKFEGFSEILAKCILMGQHPVSRIEYPFIPKCETDEDLISEIKSPFIPCRNYYLGVLNRYPWVRS